MVEDALALLELDAVASGLRALDALVKQAPVRVLEANLVEPGRFLILLCGPVAEVDEAVGAGLRCAGPAVLHHLLLPMAHPALLRGLRGHTLREDADSYDCLGVIEGGAIAPALLAVDRALKDADVRLCGLRVAGGLGGRAYAVIAGAQHDVDEGLATAEAQLRAAGALHRIERIARPHPDLIPFLLRPAPFALGREA
jgi:microcompartment protein CcmL/EutN